MSDESGPGGMDLGSIFGQVMEQARSVQGHVTEVQEKVKSMSVDGSAGGGLITVTATGDGRIKAIRIDPVAVDPRDIEMLEDLLVAGCNDALRRASEMVQDEMSSLGGGMDLGGLGSLLGKLGG